MPSRFLVFVLVYMQVASTYGSPGNYTRTGVVGTTAVFDSPTLGPYGRYIQIGGGKNVYVAALHLCSRFVLYYGIHCVLPASWARAVPRRCA
jgi:hypothetical protein